MRGRGVTSCADRRESGLGDVPRRRSYARGFTLLEVLVAVAILGLGLTAILSAQFSAVSAVSHARGLSVAVGLARCKMTELEGQLAKDGMSELDVNEHGPCCEGGAELGYRCEWRIEKPVFPPESAKLDLDAELDLGTDELGALSKLAASGEGAPGLDPNAGLAGVTDALGGADGLAAAGVGGVASMVMGLVYADLKLAFEAATRRVTVIVHWQDGKRPRSFDVVEWVTSPNMVAAVAASAAADEAELSSSSSTTGGGKR
ncbi:MAG: prepilin-type N-terminal cleavage/methylation domain-containing protein [Myxococcales bacterium]|nr:prepilin-type N-terminal cleavage/methylation domain-containing protein [Myxococcales bacterium]